MRGSADRKMMLEVDGSFGEGGGQILRTSLALAAVLGKEVRIFNVRAGRSEPGLRAQHLTSVRTIAQLCNASTRSVEIGSTEFTFRPGELKSGEFTFDVGTAGSITLVLQTIMPLLSFTPGRVKLEIRGGTDVKWSPPIDYVRLVMLPLLARIGVAISVESVIRGHYPRGGGAVRISSRPSKPLASIIGTAGGVVTKIVGSSHASNLPRHVAERQASSAASGTSLESLPIPEIKIEASDDGGLSPGSGIVLCAETENQALIGADCLGEKGIPAERVGETAANQLVTEIRSGSFLDRHMGDMIVPYIALGEGVSEVSISRMTRHTMTNIKVAESVAEVSFETQGGLDERGRLRVRGLGWK